MMSRYTTTTRPGMTLIEAAVAISLISIGLLVGMASQQAQHRAMIYNHQVASADMLARELREWMMHLPLYDPLEGPVSFGPEPGETHYTQYDDFDDFHGFDTQAIGGPMNGLGQIIADMPQWSQQITIERVAPDDLANPMALDETTGIARATVSVRYHDAPQPIIMTELSWLHCFSMEY